MHPITLSRLPVEHLNAGWYPTGLQTGLRPFHVLELHCDGPPAEDAAWYLSDDFNFVANAPGQFNAQQADMMVASLSPILRDIHDGMLCAPEPHAMPSTRVFDGIKPVFVREMIGYVVDRASSVPDVVAAHRLDGVSAHYTANGVQLSTALLRQSLEVAAPGATSEAIMMASPLDGGMLTAQSDFVPGCGNIDRVLRFVDPAGPAGPAGPLVLYLLFQPGGAASLYIPAMNTVFTTQDGLTGSQVMTSLLSYYASNGDRIPAPAGDTLEVPAASDEARAIPAANPGGGDLGAGKLQPAEVPALDGADAPVVAAAPRDWISASEIHTAEPEQIAATSHTTWWKRLFGIGNP